MLYKTLGILNRYKFTLIYGVVFWLLGGFVLAVPAVLGGLVVDKLMNRPDLKVDYKITKYTAGFWILFILVLVCIYPLFLFNGVLNFMLPFTDKMAEYIPAVDRHGEMVAKLGRYKRVEYVRHLFAVYWFWSLVLAPLIYGDLYRWAKHNIKNNFYIHFQAHEIPETIQEIEYKKYGKIMALSSDNPKFVVKLFYLLPLNLLLAVGLIYFCVTYSFYGEGELSLTRYYKGTYLITPILGTTLPANLIAIIIGSIFLSIRLIGRRKLNLKTQDVPEYDHDIARDL